MSVVSISAFFLLFLVASQGTILNWVPLTGYPKAVCNDGTVAGYYYHAGANPLKWVLYLQGGGFCYDKGSCDLRMKYSPNLMSSKNYKSTMGALGILSNNATENPYWYDATMVYVKYCSSDSFSGANPESQLGWAFMGSYIVDAAIDSLHSKGIQKATQVLFTGTSAGAEGLYPNADKVAKMLPKSNLRVLLDSGWFMDYEPFRPLPCTELSKCTEQGGLIRGVPHWTPRVDEDCQKAKPSDELWQCMLGYHAFPYLSTPAFVFQYRFDAAQMGHDGLGKPSTPQELVYARESIYNLTATFNQTKATGIFSPSCFHHGVLEIRRWGELKIQNKNLGQVFEEWRVNPHAAHIYEDGCDSPDCNPTCVVL
eukprot:TRINITY_DN16190_c0_g1_i1.p1 TRINITY_DN16190_c0_g1~~TRINITY_DN16190_c0_g1_i1.p1  ORF type:complete len:368 (-),score=73.66 TRINITY_DN16190_c0_g1_i1:9-1112(-)